MRAYPVLPALPGAPRSRPGHLPSWARRGQQATTHGCHAPPNSATGDAPLGSSLLHWAIPRWALHPRQRRGPNRRRRPAATRRRLSGSRLPASEDRESPALESPGLPAAPRHQGLATRGPRPGATGFATFLPIRNGFPHLPVDQPARANILFGSSAFLPFGFSALRLFGSSVAGPSPAFRSALKRISDWFSFPFFPDTSGSCVTP